jgi:hypothetical protein
VIYGSCSYTEVVSESAVTFRQYFPILAASLLLSWEIIARTDGYKGLRLSGPTLSLTDFTTSSHIHHTHLALAMRSTTVIYFFIASWVLASREGTTFLCGWVELNLFSEPAVFATPVPSQANSAGVKRGCPFWGCKFAEAVRIFPYSWLYNPCLLLVSRPTPTLRPKWTCKTWLTC